MKINEVLIILANHNLRDKLETVLRETNSEVGYRATLNWFEETAMGKVYTKMIKFGCIVKNNKIIFDHDSFFITPEIEEFITILKEFEEIEDDFFSEDKFSGNILDKLYGWMYEWIEVVAYAYDPQWWSDCCERAESYDVPFIKCLTGEAQKEISEFISDEFGNF